jgi:hypothetical protein
MLTDLMVYDWWELILGFAGEKIEGRSGDSRIEKQIKWVGELMIDNGVRALPRVSIVGSFLDNLVLITQTVKGGSWTSI